MYSQAHCVVLAFFPAIDLNVGSGRFYVLQMFKLAKKNKKPDFSLD